MQALEKVSQFRSISEALMKSLGQRSMKDLEIQFKGELTVKMILLGMGSVGTLAGQPPIWATGGSRSVMPCLHESCLGSSKQGYSCCPTAYRETSRQHRLTGCDAWHAAK